MPIFLKNIKGDIFFHLEIKKKSRSFPNYLMTFFSIRMMPTLLYRISYLFFELHLKPISKIFSLINFIFFGIEIAINTKIGSGLFFPHTNGTVIGAKVIGEKSIIYHNVTIGAKFIDTSNDLIGRPVIGNNIKIATGSIILGDITIGNNVIIGPNIVILKSIDSNTKILINSC